MSLLSDVLGAIDSFFALLGIIDLITIPILLIGYWNGIVSGNVAALSSVILILVTFIVGAIESDILQSIIEGIATVIVTIVEGIASLIEAIVGIFS
jgi:hypothetical protein